jgi:plasmid stabilization system protein ParE
MTKTPRRTRSLSRLASLNQMLLSDTLDIGVFMDSVSEEIRGLTSCPKSGIWIVGGGTLSIRTDVALCDTLTVRNIKIESLTPEVRNTILSEHPVELVGGDRVAHHAVDPGYVQATGIHYMYRRPVLDRGEVVAVLVAARDNPKTFDAFEVEVMGMLSTQVALSVRALRVALEIARDIAAAKDAEHARTLRRVLGRDR